MYQKQEEPEDNSVVTKVKHKLNILNYIKEPKDIYEALFPLHVLSVFLCISPLTRAKTSNGKSRYKFSYRQVAVNSAIVVLFLVILIYCIIRYRQQFMATLESKMQYFGGGLSGTLASVEIIFGCIFGKKMVKVFTGIDDVEAMLKSLNVQVAYKRIYLDVIINIILCLLVAAYIIIFYIFIYEIKYSNINHALMTSMFFFPYFVNIVMEIQYISTMRILKTRFHEVNDYLNTILKKKKTLMPSWVDDNIKIIDKPQSILKPPIYTNKETAGDPVLIVDNVAALHIKLSDIATWVNLVYCVQLLLRITIAFVGIVTALFVIGVNFVNTSSDDEKLNLNVMFTSWAFSGAIEVWLIVWVTCKVCEEATKCPRIMHKIRNNTKNSKLQDAIEHYSLQMYHNRLRFDVCGLFPLDYTLLYTIIAGVTTYLVILIQFNNSDYLRKGNILIANNITTQKPA